MHQALLYLLRLHKLFLKMGWILTESKKPTTITLNSPAGIICLFTEITLAMVLNIDYASIHFIYFKLWLQKTQTQMLPVID